MGHDSKSDLRDLAPLTASFKGGRPADDYDRFAALDAGLGAFAAGMDALNSDAPAKPQVKVVDTVGMHHRHG